MYDKDLQNLIDKVKAYAPNANFDLIVKAYDLGKKAHEGQYRKSGEPYFIHPIAVANILADMQMDIETITGALLHDVVEDTEYSIEDINEMFGKDVGILVDGVTKLGKIKYQTKEESQSENLRKMFLAMAKDIRVILIKLADRLHNMRTLEYMDEEKAKYKAKETIEIYGALANRLGISKIKAELEDIALRYLDEEGYFDLASKVKKKRNQREEYIDKVIEILKDSYKKAGIKCEVYGRPKHFYSIYRKMKKKHKSFDEIYDLTAVRVLVDTVRDCYAALGIAHTLWRPIPGRFKDYIAMPKPNMYQSLHTTVMGPDGEPVEIQIRTYEMHNTAEYGIAAHWKYKEGISNKKVDIEEKLQWLRQMMEWEKDVKDPQEFMDSLKEEVFNSQVYVFTPQGDIMELPLGSTPIDFAYRVHTNVGHKCVGAKVNGRIVPLDYQLSNGNIVEVLTNANSIGPSRDWLNIVKTPNARNRIRHFFKRERREENLERGIAIMDKEYKRLDIPKGTVNIDKYILAVAKMYNQPNIEDFLATIGYGGIVPSQAANKIKDLYLKDLKKNQKQEAKQQEEEAKVSKLEENYNKKRKRTSNKGVIVDGLGNILIRMARCCNPLPGDDIVGYITKGRGVAIHRRDCPNVQRDLEINPSRFVHVEWNDSEASRYEVDVEIKAIDRKGIINEITHIITNEKVLLNGMNAKKDKSKGSVNVDLLVEIESVSDLQSLMKKIKNIPGVDEVYRQRN